MEVTVAKTRFISDESMVPEGYVPMADYQHDPHLHRALSDAHKSGDVSAVKLVRHEGDIVTGRVWVRQADVEAFVSGRAAAGRTVRQKTAAQPTVVDERFWAMAKTWVEIRDLLERIADAVETGNRWHEAEVEAQR